MKVTKTNINIKDSLIPIYLFEINGLNITVIANITNSTPYLRVHSACITSEIFKSNDCDCREQLDYSISKITHYGGLVIYLQHQEGRGHGIKNKLKGMNLSLNNKLSTVEAYQRLGITTDCRTYKECIDILDYFNIKKVKLLTNNPDKILFFKENDIEVYREPIIMETNINNKPYIKSKRDEMGHMI